MKLTLMLLALLIAVPVLAVALAILPVAVAVESARWLVGRVVTWDRERELREHLDTALQQVWDLQREAVGRGNRVAMLTENWN